MQTHQNANSQAGTLYDMRTLGTFYEVTPVCAVLAVVVKYAW
jgi:hypothetical protein